MIAGEVAVFLSMFAGGTIAGVIAIFLLTLGRGSRAARAVFDSLAPLAVGVIFFFSVYDSSGGVFRLYSLVAFTFGIIVVSALYRRSLPIFRRALCRIIVPIKSLERRVEQLFDPLKKKWKARIAAGREKRKEKRAFRAEKRAEVLAGKARERLEKKEKRQQVRRIVELRRRLRREGKKEGRSASLPSMIGQSH